MKFCESPFNDDPARYLTLLEGAVALERHVDLLQWVQGDFQHYLPHDVLLTGWGNFEEGCVQHDVLSSLPGVRSYAPGTECLPFLLSKMNDLWAKGGRKPRMVGFSEFEYLLGSVSLPNSFCGALRGMRSALVHGITDLRGKNDCVYVFLSTREIQAQDLSRAEMSLVGLLPVLDTALRQISHLPQQQMQVQAQAQVTPPQKSAAEDTTGLSERETQIMAWVAMGKTNLEIGSILNISGFTVKNHMQRIFQKLNVFNRAQAVSKVTRVSLDV